MQIKQCALVTLAIFAVPLTVGESSAAKRSTKTISSKAKWATTIEVEGMHCKICARRLTKGLSKVAGVDSSKADVKKGVVVVTPKQTNRLPSPRAQWEAVEKAKFKPIKLKGPYGTFTKKPASEATKRKATAVANRASATRRQ